MLLRLFAHKGRDWGTGGLGDWEGSGSSPSHPVPHIPQSVSMRLGFP